MFDEIKNILDEYEKLIRDETCSIEKYKWFDDYEFNMAKALNRELPSCSKIAKMLCIMNDDEIKIQIK